MARRGGGGGAIPELVEGTVKKFIKKAEVRTPRGSSHTPGGGGPSGVPKSTPKPKRPLPKAVLERMRKGNEFNKQNHHRFDNNEVTLENGKRLDSYQHGEAIVSRKHTQLADVDEKTARSYINEIDNKYAPGTVMKDSPNSAPYGGLELQGRKVLEVPVQNGPIPQSILEHATSRKVLIKDPTGHTYNPPKGS